MLINLRDKMTRLIGAITPEVVNTLKDEIGGVFTVIKTHHFTQGQKYSHLASAIPEGKYRIVITDPDWTYAPPIDLGAYSQTALEAGNTAALQEQLVAEHKVRIESYVTYLKVEEAGKELILNAAGNDALAALKKQYIGFGDVTIHDMIDHLRTKTAIRTKGYNSPWDPSTSIAVYFTHLNWFQISLVNRGIATRDDEKVMAAGAQMWESKMFTEEQMLAWENKPAADQMWANLQAYFTKKWLESNQYLSSTAKQSRFKEAELAAQEKEAWL